MNKIALAATAALVLSSNVFAAEYRCYGKETVARPSSIDTVLVVTATKVKFQDMDGDTQELDRVSMKNESKNTYATYGNYEYDGYGGFIELRVPKKIRAGSFPAYFQQDVYSELGKVAEIRIALKCSSN